MARPKRDGAAFLRSVSGAVRRFAGRHAVISFAAAVSAVTFWSAPVFGDETGPTGTESLAATTVHQLRLVQTYRAFTSDLFAAGLDEEKEKRLRRHGLVGLSTNTMTTDELLIRFQSTWLDIQRELDQAKRQMICQQSVLDADSSIKANVVALKRHLERSIYERHMILQAAELHAQKQFDLEEALMKYAQQAAIPAVFEGRRAQIRPKPGYSMEQALEIQLSGSVEGFCSTPWRYQIGLPQADGTNKIYRITL